MVVAIAAPVNPIAGINQSPLINIGHNIILMMFANQRLFMAIAAFPAPLNIPLIKKSSIMNMLPLIMICIKAVPLIADVSEAPKINNNSLALINPTILSTIVIAIDMMIACTPALAAPSYNCSSCHTHTDSKRINDS